MKDQKNSLLIKMEVIREYMAKPTLTDRERAGYKSDFNLAALALAGLELTAHLKRRLRAKRAIAAWNHAIASTPVVAA